MTIRPSISLITLGVSDVERSTQFYERLGWSRSGASVPGTSFIALEGLVLALFGRADLAADAEVVAAGARLVKPARKLEWGGYGGYFADPDRHLWEVAMNPFWPLDAAGK